MTEQHTDHIVILLYWLNSQDRAYIERKEWIPMLMLVQNAKPYASSPPRIRSQKRMCLSIKHKAI